MSNIFENEKNESAIQTIKETMKVFAADDGTPMDDDNIVSFRVRSGKGAKPAKIQASDFQEVASLLESTVSPVEAAADRLSPSTELATTEE